MIDTLGERVCQTRLSITVLYVCPCLSMIPPSLLFTYYSYSSALRRLLLEYTVHTPRCSCDCIYFAEFLDVSHQVVWKIFCYTASLNNLIFNNKYCRIDYRSIIINRMW